MIVEFDLVPAYDSFDEVNPYISSQNLTPTGHIIDEEDSGSDSGTGDSGSESGGDSHALSVFDLNSTHLFALTGSESAFEGNYSIIEEDDGQGATYLTAMPMVLVNGVWDEDPDGIPYPLNSQDFPVMQDVDSYFQAQNLHPVNQNAGDGGDGPQGLPVYTLSQTQVDSLVGANVTNAGTYAIEIWTDSSGVENKKLVSAVQDENNDWHREEDANGVIVEFDLVPAYDSFDEVETFLSTEGFMEPFTEEGTAEVTFVFVDGQPTGFIVDSEDTDSGSGSETTLSSNGTPVQWARTNGDSVSGVIYDLAQPIKIIAPTGYTVVLKNVGENEEYDTELTVVDDVHAVLAATGNIDGKGYGGIFYKSDNDTDWDHWTTTYVAYAKAQTTDSGDPGSGSGSDSGTDDSGSDSDEDTASHGLPVYTLSQTQVDSLVGANVANSGTYAIEIWTDFSSSTENKKLVSAEHIDNEWHREEDSNGVTVEFDLVPAYDSFDEVNGYISSQNLTPTGHIIDEEEEHHGPFNFTIIDEIELNNQQELIDLSSEHDDIWFQHVNLVDGRYIWALSVENDDENGPASESSNLMIEMNGSVYEGDFHAYWRDKFEIDVDNNSSSNWRENRFDANQSGINELYTHYPEIRGVNAPLPPIVKTLRHSISQGTKLIFGGEIIADGNNDHLELGIQISSDFYFSEPIEIFSENNGNSFEVDFDTAQFDSNKLFYRATAKNQLFESFGAIKRLSLSNISATVLVGAEKNAAGWEHSHWFGDYLPQPNRWLYHTDLGWCFVVINHDNHWLWMEEHGWLWTTPEVWPYMFKNETSSWIYLLQRKSGPAVIFDQLHQQFIPIQK